MDPNSLPTAFPLGGWLWKVLMSPRRSSAGGCRSGAAPCCACADLPELYPLRQARTAAFCADANPMNGLSARVAGGVFPDGVRAREARSGAALFLLRDLDRPIPARRGPVHGAHVG